MSGRTEVDDDSTGKAWPRRWPRRTLRLCSAHCSPERSSSRFSTSGTDRSSLDFSRTEGGPDVALPGFSSESALRSMLDGVTDWVAVDGQQWAVLARTNGLAGVLDPGSGSYVLDPRTIDQLADGLVPAVGDEPAHLALDLTRQVRLPQSAEATAVGEAVAAAGVGRAVVDLGRNGYY